MSLPSPPSSSVRWLAPKRWLRPRHVYFTYCLVSATPGRFLPLLLTWFGMQPSLIGLLLAMQVVLSYIAMPLLSHRADVRGRGRVLAMLQLVASVMLMLQGVVGSFWLFTNPLSSSPSPSTGEGVPATASAAVVTFLFATTAASGVASSALEPIVRGLTVAFLIDENGGDSAKGPMKFGSERLWGAVSWALGSLITSIFFDFPSHTASLFATYALHIVCAVMFIASVALFPRPSNPTDTGCGSSEPAQHVSLPQALRAVLLHGGMTTVLFFNTVFWFGVGVSVVENLLFLYLVTELHASNLLCGLSIVFSVMIEIPMYAVAPRLLSSSLPGVTPATILLVAAVAYVVRVVGYALVSTPMAALGFELLHGVTFASADAAFFSLLATRGAMSVPGAEASVQATYSVVRAVGMATGAGLGGFILQSAGASTLYVLAAIVVMAAASAFAVGFERQQRKWRRSQGSGSSNRDGYAPIAAWGANENFDA